MRIECYYFILSMISSMSTIGSTDGSFTEEGQWEWKGFRVTKNQ